MQNPYPVKRLVAREFVVKKGDQYIYLQDPETGKFYEPKPGWEVTGEDLEGLFQEILTERNTGDVR